MYLMLNILNAQNITQFAIKLKFNFVWVWDNIILSSLVILSLMSGLV